jgi:hypothetical protein
MSSRICRSPALSIAVQAAAMRQHYPFGGITTTPSQLRWRGVVKHDGTSRPYTVELIYKLGFHPDVFVREPNLKLLAGDDRKLPHVYEQETQWLCLYVRGANWWTADKLIAATVMPWTCLWFRLFENWLVTNVWHGAEDHPTPLRPYRKLLALAA